MLSLKTEPGLTSNAGEERLIRVSSGTAICLGLRKGALGVKPTTAYLLTHVAGKCMANCAFCSQARDSSSEAEMLSRVRWPLYSLGSVLEGLTDASDEGVVQRVCMQALEYPDFSQDVAGLVEAIRSVTSLPISVACPLLTMDGMDRLRALGVESLGISIDAASEEVFDRVKGWRVGCSRTLGEYIRAVQEAVDCFGRGKVVTHLIAGLGETEEQMLSLVQKVVGMGAYPALFAFTPIPGTALERTQPPSVESYRRLQLGRHLITCGLLTPGEMRFGEDGSLINLGKSVDALRTLVSEGTPFLTSGCPGCNRPYYNEGPQGPMYNYPRPLNLEDISQVRRKLASLLRD